MSDLRRFWGGRPEEFTLPELVAFYESLSPDSATATKLSGSVVPMSEVLQALTIDAINSFKMGFSKHRLKESEMIAPMLSAEKIQNESKHEEVKRQLIEKVRHNGKDEIMRMVMERSRGARNFDQNKDFARKQAERKSGRKKKPSSFIIP